MANRRFNQFLFSHNAGLTLLEGSCIIDSGVSGKTKSLRGSGIKAVTNVGTGLYKVQLEDSFSRFLGMQADFRSTIGSPIGIASGSSSTLYIIASVGTTSQAQWEAAGVPAGVPAAAGLAFVSIAGSLAGITGTGTVAVPAFSGVNAVEVVGDPNLSIVNLSDPHFIIATMASSAAAPALTMNSYTPAGTNTAPALTMDSYTPAGTNDGSSPPLFTGTPAVLTGSVAAPVFTGTPATLTGSVAAPAVSSAAVAPRDLSVLEFSILLRNSSVKCKGE